MAYRSALQPPLLLSLSAPSTPSAPGLFVMYTHQHSDDGGLRPMAIPLQEDTSSDWSSFVGIITAIIGNILISFALNVQRYAHVRLEEESNDQRSSRILATPKGTRIPSYGAIQQDQQQDDITKQRFSANPSAPQPAGNDQDSALPPDCMQDSFQSDNTVRSGDDQEEYGSRKTYLKSKIWWTGIVMMTVGEAGNFLAYGFAPASIVSPLGVVALVSNCLIAPLILKEPFRQRDFWGVVVAILGAITVVLSANQNEAKLDPDLLWHYYIKRWEFLVYVLITAVAIIGLMIASPKYGKRTLAIDIGLVGLFGGYTAIATKGVAALLSSSLYKAFTFPIFYALLFLLVLFAIMQIRYLTNALQNFNSTQVIPTQFVCFTLSVIIGSAVLYREFESETTGRAIKFVAGCLLTFFGVYLITSKHTGARRGDKGVYNEDSDQVIHLVDEGVEGTEPTTLHGESTPKTSQSVPSTPFPVTPPRSPSPTEIPSIAVTPAEPAFPSSPQDHPTPVLTPLRAPIPQSFTDIDQTPYFTPTTSKRTVLRTDSSPGDLETPTKHQRTPSLPKADISTVVAAENDRRRFLLSPRDSIRVLLPGPLLGPMASSPLSGIVADSLRRGESSTLSVRKRSGRSRTLRYDLPHGIGPSDEETGLLRHATHEGSSSKKSTSNSHANDAVVAVVDDDDSGGGGAAAAVAHGESNKVENQTHRYQSRLRAMSETLGLLIRGGSSGSGSGHGHGGSNGGGGGGGDWSTRSNDDNNDYDDDGGYGQAHQDRNR